MRIFLSFLSVTILPLSFLCFGTSYLNYKMTTDEFSDKNQVILAQAGAMLMQSFTEVESWQMAFSSNYKVIHALERCIENPEKLTYTYYYALNIIKSFLCVPSNYRKHIYSTYIYVEGYRYYLSSSEGIVSLENTLDNGWSRQVPNSHMEVRTIPNTNIEVLSIYRTLNGVSSSAYSSKGVIVFNIKTDYILSCLREAATFPGQCVFIASQSNNLLISYPKDFWQEEFRGADIFSLTGSRPQVKIAGKTYLVDSHSYDSGISFVMLTPRNEIFALPNYINRFFMVIILFSIISGFAIALLFTTHQYRQIMTIINFLNSAEKNPALVKIDNSTHDEYSYILQNVVSTFVRNNAMKEQIRTLSYERRMMEMIALQSQINPHFLYNTFETINWKLIKKYGKPTEVNDMITDLSDILSYSLETPLSTVTLNQEIDITESYVRIMQERDKRQFVLEWIVDCSCKQLKIPRMIFQPLVENSIMHGFDEQCPHPRIRIRISRRKDTVRIRLTDNGVGMDRETLKNLREKLAAENSSTENIGLCNTSHRLRIVYGAASGIHIFSIQSKGTCVYFDIPPGVRPGNGMEADGESADSLH